MRDELIARAARMGVAVSPDQAAQFERFHVMLAEANARMNLTRVPDDRSEAIDRNYLDSIAPLAFDLIPEKSSLVDVGSGAGFPGVPLAIMRTDVSVTLMDSIGKRVEFLNGAIEMLSLNARALCVRAEDAGRKPDLREAFDIATARAVAPLSVLSEFALPLLRVGGWMIAYKGPAWENELDEGMMAIQTLGGEFVTAKQVEIPGRDWAHALILIKKVSSTDAKYPRRAGIPEKRPL
jgi:16S rRNA (guanine527-N7)-methyltransferase